MTFLRSPLLPAVLLAFASGALVVLGPHRATLTLALVPWVLAFLALGWIWLGHRDWLGRPIVLLGGAALLRLLFLIPLPDLSDDLFRYVWDGLVSLDGMRPYSVIPADPSLAHLHDTELFAKMNSPEYISIYPPLSQWVFLLGGWAYSTVGWPGAAWVVKAGFLALEGLGVYFLYGALRRLPVPPASLALYAWNPLVLLAVAGGGHTEGGLVLGFGLLVYGLTRTREKAGAWLVWAGWGIAVLSKGIPLVLAPLVWRAVQARGMSGRANGLVAVIVMAGMALASLPFLRPSDLAGIAGSAQLYVGLFEFNAGLYYSLQSLVGLWPGPGLPVHLGSVLLLTFVGGASWLVLRHPVGTPQEVARGILLVLSLHLVLATTVHPWYLLWVLPFIPFTSTLRGPWLWGSFAALPTYLTYAGVSHMLLTTIFWSGWLILALHERREWILRPLRRLAGIRKARWIEPWMPKSSGRWLDVGGGEGWVAAVLSRDRPRSESNGWVVDPMATASPWPHRVRARGEHLPFPDDAAEAVILSFVLHHASEPDRVLGEALRVASDRVVLLETTPSSPLSSRVLGVLDRWVNAERGDGSMGVWDAPLEYRQGDEWARAAERLGARVISIDRPNRVGHPVTRLVLEVGRARERDQPRVRPVP